MPPLPVITDTFRCALHWDGGSGGTAVNVIHVRSGSPAPTEIAVFNCIDAHVTRTMFDAQSDTFVVNEIAITHLDGTSATLTFSTGSPTKWTGAGSGGPEPAVANIIKLGTLLRGRSHRGRIFLPGVAESEADTGRLVSATRTSVEGAWQTFVAAMSTDGTTPLDLVVASYKLATATPVDFVTAEGALATQRKRQERLR